MTLVLHTENPKEFNEKTRINKFSKITGYESNIYSQQTIQK